MSFFAGFGLSDAPLDPSLPDGDYLAEVVDVVLEEYEVKDEQYAGNIGHRLVFVYEVIEGPYEEFTVNSRKQYLNPWDSRKRKSYVNRMVINHGVVASKIEAVEKNDLIGLIVSARVRDGEVVSVQPRSREECA